MEYGPHIIVSIIGSVAGTFNFLAVRKIGKNVHSSVKQMYLGIVGLILSIFYLLITQPEYFYQSQYTRQMATLTAITAFFFYIMQMSLSLALENLKAGTVCCFFYLSVIISFFL